MEQFCDIINMLNTNGTHYDSGNVWPFREHPQVY